MRVRARNHHIGSIMENTSSPYVWKLEEDECWNLLGRGEVGRLAVIDDGVPNIFPVNYIADGGRILFRTAPDSKLAALNAVPDVAFEVDEFDDAAAASVVVRGIARALSLQREIDLADALKLKPWIPTLKYRWVRIAPRSITGRRFVRTAEPVRYAASRRDENA